MAESAPKETKAKHHPRSRHLLGYDFQRLAEALPALQAFLGKTVSGHLSIDFSDPKAVIALNRALLAADYRIRDWHLPPGYLCPGVPGRADLLHALADLLASEHSHVPYGDSIRVLDIGVGANGIYPLIGQAEYGWNFIGVDIDRKALEHLEQLLVSNRLHKAIRLRHQAVAQDVFRGVLRHGESFDLSLCNPPFHASPEAAAQGTLRKWKQLGRPTATNSGPKLNFGGQSNELWCPGGERAFLQTMIDQSQQIAKRCLWFSTLVSKAEYLPALHQQLARHHPDEVRVIELSHGQKSSRLIAWTFHSRKERQQWRQKRWGNSLQNTTTST